MAAIDEVIRMRSFKLTQVIPSTATALSALPLSSIPGASQEETGALKRNTRWPKQDFIVLPLESSTSKAIASAIGGSVPNTIIHIQIEKDGTLLIARLPESTDFFAESAWAIGTVR